MTTIKRIINEDSWKEDKFWKCPYCFHQNKLSTWMDQEIQIFETDYIDAYEGVLSTNYLGPAD